MDPYERVRRILVDDSYSGCDIEADAKMQRAAEVAVNQLRRMVDRGKDLERMVDTAHTIADVEAILQRLDCIAEEDETLVHDLTTRLNTR